MTTIADFVESLVNLAHLGTVGARPRQLYGEVVGSSGGGTDVKIGGSDVVVKGLSHAAGYGGGTTPSPNDGLVLIQAIMYDLLILDKVVSAG